MHADLPAAGRTRPPFAFVLEKSLDASLFHGNKILYGARIIPGAVPLVQAQQIFTGRFTTLKAEPVVAAPGFFTALQPANDACYRLVGFVCPAARTAVPLSQECPANRTVEATRGYELSLREWFHGGSAVCFAGECIATI